MSGGGGGGPTSSTVTQTNIPDWLRPQVESVLGAGMQEMFQTQKGEDGNYQITGMKPYTPYSENPEDYVAGFSPLQQQAFGSTANLRVPGQFMEGTGMAQQAGMGGFGAAQQAAGIAGMQAGAGNQYMQMATNPFATQAFMSPYMQNVVNVQQQQAQRQADIANQATQAKIAQSGGFGGRGAFLTQSQANADLMRQKQGIQATGLQSAFEQAQKAQQFGADLGLRGLTGAQQGMSNVIGGFDLLGRQGTNVANIGAQQLGAQKDIIGLQAQMGGMEQARQQQIINQSVQDFANRRESPMQRLNAYNALLRGYAAPGYTSTQYQAAPPMASQLAGLGATAYGASRMLAEGGKIEEPKRMATGGIASINRKVLNDPDSVTYDQIRQGVKNETVSDLIGVPIMQEKQEFARRIQAAAPPQQPQQPIKQGLLAAAAPQGIDTLPSNLAMNMAKGGIVAFSGTGESLVTEEGSEEAPKSLQQQLMERFPDLAEGSINDPKLRAYISQRTPELFRQLYGFKYDDMTPEETTQQYNAAMARAKAAAGASPIDALRAQLGGLYGSRDTEADKGAAWMQAGAAMMQPGMTFAQGLGQAGSVLGQKYAQIAKDDTAAKRARAQMEFNLADAERKERMGLHRDATASVAQAAKNRRDAKTAEFNRLKGITDLSTRTLAATRPPGTGGSGKPPPFKLDQELFNSILADLQVQYPGYDPIELRRMAAERAVAQTRDFGPGRAAGAATGPTVRAAEEMAAARQSWNFTLEGVQAARLKASKDPEERQRGEALEKAFEAKLQEQFGTVPTPAQARESATPQAKPTRPKPSAAPATKPDIKQVQGAPAGATIGAQTARGWEIVNASGKVIGYVGE